MVVRAVARRQVLAELVLPDQLSDAVLEAGRDTLGGRVSPQGEGRARHGRVPDLVTRLRAVRGDRGRCVEPALDLGRIAPGRLGSHGDEAEGFGDRLGRGPEVEERHVGDLAGQP